MKNFSLNVPHGCLKQTREQSKLPKKWLSSETPSQNSKRRETTLLARFPKTKPKWNKRNGNGVARLLTFNK